MEQSTGGRDAWDKLKEVHSLSAETAERRITRRLHKTRMKPDSSMEEHLQAMLEGFHELDVIGAGMKQKASVNLLLASLSDEYDPLVTALESWDETRLTLTAVRAKLLEEWRKKTAHSAFTARFSVNRGRFQPLPTSSQAVRKAFVSSWDNTASDYKGTNLSNKICYKCRRYGHLSSDCPGTCMKPTLKTPLATVRLKKPMKPSTARESVHAKIKELWTSGRLSDLNIVAGKKDKTTNLSNKICYHCQRYGHLSSDCPDKCMEPTLKTQLQVGKVHKSILGMHSSVMEKTFQDDTTDVQIKLKEVKEGGNAMENFAIAEKFKLDGMKSICEFELMVQLDNSNAFEIFMLAHQHSSEILKKQAFVEIGKMLGVILPDGLMGNLEKIKELIDAKRAREKLLGKLGRQHTLSK